MDTTKIEEVRQLISLEADTETVLVPVGDLRELLDLAEARLKYTIAATWEYGARHSQGINAGGSRSDAERMVSDFVRRDTYLRPEARGKAKLMRRRKAGGWEPVESDE